MSFSPVQSQDNKDEGYPGYPQIIIFHSLEYELEEDLHLIDAFVKERPLKVFEHSVPVITNFVDPIPFKIRTM